MCERDVIELPVQGGTVGKTLLNGKSQAMVWRRGRRAGIILWKTLGSKGGGAVLRAYSVCSNVCPCDVYVCTEE